jgi:cobalamin synthase
MLAVMIGALAVYRGIETFTRRQLGGQTGDAAGAAQQLGEIAVLLILSAPVALTAG